MEQALKEQGRQAEREADRPSTQAEARAQAVADLCEHVSGSIESACLACVADAIQAERDGFLRMVLESHEWGPTGASGKEFLHTLKNMLKDCLIFEMGAK